jgi:predicted NAD/FAD-dependent oxidoreductase
VIIGGGFAGLAAAKTLRHADADVRVGPPFPLDSSAISL